MSGSFRLHIYTTSPINGITIQRSSQQSGPSTTSDEEQFLIERQYSSTFDILSVYEVGVPWLTRKINGDYQIKVTNEDGESGTLDIKIMKAEGTFESLSRGLYIDLIEGIIL